MSKFNLFMLLVAPSSKPVTIAGVMGYLESIEREDGSGSSFNVTLTLLNGKRKTVYVRTID